MRGKHDDGKGGIGDDHLPGQPWSPTSEPTTDSSAPSGGGQHRDDEDEDGK
ncbi:hypothetical protein [Streptomyces mayteni]